MSDKILQVKSASIAEPAIVVLDDQDEAHPDGYVKILRDGKAHAVGNTARVRELLGDGTLVVVEPKAAPKAAAS